MNQQTPKPTARRHSFASRLFGYDIFISYALGAPPRGTLSYASDLARRLRERDFTVFFSEDEAPPGDQLDSTLRTALHRSKSLVVIANRGTLHDPRWVRTEVQEFRRRHPHRPAIPISVGGALEDPALSADAQEWLGFKGTIWLPETDDAVGRGIASETLIDRLATAPTRLKSNVTWRWVVRSVVAGLILLTATAAWQWYLAGQQRRNAESRMYAARALRAVEADPAEALRFAITSGELGDNPDSEAALRSAIGASHLVAVFFHDGGTTDADFASTRVVTVGSDSRVRFWSGTNGQSSQDMRVVSGVPGGLRGITVSPNGKRAAVWGGSSKVAVWDLISNREVHRFDTGDGTAQVGFSPDGADVIAVHGASVTRRRTEDGSKLRKISGTVLRDATVSADGTLLAAGSDDGQRVQLYDAQNGALVKILNTGGSVRWIGMSADAKWLAAISEGQAPGFKIWNITDPKNPVESNSLRLDVLDVRVECALFFPRTQPLRLVTGSSDGVVRVWKAKENGEWELVSSLRGNTKPVSDVTVSRDENIVVSAGTDGTARVWIQKPGSIMSRESWTALSVARGHHKRITKVRLSDDGRRMVTVGREEGCAMLWDTGPDREAATVGPLFFPVEQVVVDPHGTRLALLANGSPWIFSVIDNKLSQIGSRDMFGKGSYNEVGLSPNGKSVVVAGRKDETAIYDVATGKELVALRGQAGHVVSAEYNQSGTRIVTAGDDNSLRVWDAASAKLLASIDTGKQPATKATFSPDGSCVLSLGSDQPARVWSTKGKFLAMLGKEEAHDACFNAKGTRLWTAERNTARVWNTKNWRSDDEVLSSLTSQYFVKPLGEGYTFFSDSKGTVELVAPDKRRTTFPPGHKARVSAVALSSDHSRLVTGDSSGEVIVWDTSAGQVASKIGDHTAEVTDIAFSRDGRFFATASEDGTARLYTLRVSDLVTLARARLPQSAQLWSNQNQP